MSFDAIVHAVLDRAQEGRAPTHTECAHLLTFPTESREACLTMAVANAISRERFHNAGILQAQIGIEIAPCPGNCGSCIFGEDHTPFKRTRCG
jgi:biotin synthase